MALPQTALRVKTTRFHSASQCEVPDSPLVSLSLAGLTGAPSLASRARLFDCTDVNHFSFPIHGEETYV